MAARTKYFGMVYFQLGDSLNSDFSAQAEIDRFVFIDKQLYGIMSVFGNGVVEGWEVTQIGDFDISISPGYGNINFIACATQFPVELYELGSNVVQYLYAKTEMSTPSTAIPTFITLPTKTNEDPNLLLLAEILTDGNSIIKIDNSVRNEISFLQIIRNTIALHRHRGGPLNPSKINLETEVQGQLPSFRIKDFDAKKITTGIFDLARLPLINHSDLENVGILTHPQLDTFIKTIETSNRQLFGEIGVANIMQFILALKFIFDDPNSSYYINKLFDENMINQIAIIPGITPNSYIDFDSSTAEIDLVKHEIRGQIPKVGTSFWITYDTDMAWNSAILKKDVLIANNSVTLKINYSDELNRINIENFENAKQPGEDLSKGNPFTRIIIPEGETAKVTAESSSLNVNEGFYSAEFRYKQRFNIAYVKNFATEQDWSTYDSFIFKIKCFFREHGPVKLFFYDSSNNTSAEYTILDTNEMTEGDSPDSNGFNTRVINISEIPFNTKIKGFTIYCRDTNSDFYFFIDDMYIQRAVLLPREGYIRLRYSTRQIVTFRMLEWRTIEPSGTRIIVEARTANNTALLNRSSFVEIPENGSLIDLKGTDIEVQIRLFPDAARVIAPVLKKLRIQIVSDSEIDGFLLNAYEDFSRGKSENINISKEPAYISLQSPINVGSYYFISTNKVQQNAQTISNDGHNYITTELAVFGHNTPIAPNLIFKHIEEGKTNITLRQAKLFEPRSVRRTSNRSFLIADTYNDRILEMSEDGKLINGFGSINYQHNDKVFPIASCFDVRSNIFYVVWSKPINFAQVNLNQITIQTSTQRIKLFNGHDKIMGLNVNELQRVNPSGQIMPVHLSIQNASHVNTMRNQDTFAFFGNLVLPTPINIDSAFYGAIFTGQGIPCYVGPFAYIDGIFCPTWAAKLEDGRTIVCNATLLVKDYKFPDNFQERITFNGAISDIVIVDDKNVLIALPEMIKFSPFIPGRAQEIGNNLLIIGGINKDSRISNIPQEFDFRTISGSQERRNAQREILREIFKNVKSDMIIYDMSSKTIIFRYSAPEHMIISDVDVTPDGNYMIAESSFSKSGRIICVDNYGNIIFSYGEGYYSIINDIAVQYDGSVVIST